MFSAASMSPLFQDPGTSGFRPDLPSGSAEACTSLEILYINGLIMNTNAVQELADRG